MKLWINLILEYLTSGRIRLSPPLLLPSLCHLKRGCIRESTDRREQPCAFVLTVRWWMFITIVHMHILCAYKRPSNYLLHHQHPSWNVSSWSSGFRWIREWGIWLTSLGCSVCTPCLQVVPEYRRVQFRVPHGTHSTCDAEYREKSCFKFMSKKWALKVRLRLHMNPPVQVLGIFKKIGKHMILFQYFLFISL